MQGHEEEKPQESEEAGCVGGTRGYYGGASAVANDSDDRDEYVFERFAYAVFTLVNEYGMIGTIIHDHPNHQSPWCRPWYEAEDQTSPWFFE